MSTVDIQRQFEYLEAMPKETIKEFHPLLKVQSSSETEHMMVGYLIRWLTARKLSHYVDNMGNIVVTKGVTDIYPCIVAHMDTVHRIHDRFRIKYKKKRGRDKVLAFSGDKQVGVGGDDKCGIFAVLKMLEKHDTIKAVFFTEEETGMKGSSGIDLEFFNDVGYIFQLDRWGSGDFISQYWQTSTTSAAFNMAVNDVMLDYGYRHTDGLTTDCMNLWDRSVGVACVNISCGYYQHHSNGEFIDLNELHNSIKFVNDLILSLGGNRYTSIPDENRYDYSKYDDIDYKGDGWSWWNKRETLELTQGAYGEGVINGELFEDCMHNCGWAGYASVTEEMVYWMQYEYQRLSGEPVSFSEMENAMEDYRHALMDDTFNQADIIEGQP